MMNSKTAKVGKWSFCNYTIRLSDKSSKSPLFDPNHFIAADPPILPSVFHLSFHRSFIGEWAIKHSLGYCSGLFVQPR